MKINVKNIYPLTEWISLGIKIGLFQSMYMY